jgi:signal transduction histidine kinase/DNA-binding response OmpR family regulator/ligand-binding sensor domain-containing protein
MSRSIRIAFVALVLCAIPTFAADEWCPTRAFRMFGKAVWRGLPQSSVVAMAQDSDGVLWIGTLDGAASFDGSTITPVPAVPGAPLRGLIGTIIPRKEGGVYVATSAGVHIFDRSTWQLVPTRKAAVTLAETRDGTLWMNDLDGSVLSLRGGESWQVHKEIGAPALALASAPDGALWIATEDSALRLHNGRVEHVPGAPLPGRPSTMIVAHDGRAWVATLAGTVHWTSGSADKRLEGGGWHQAAFTPWPRGAFRSMAEDRKGRVWAGAYGGHVAFGNAEIPWTVWDVRAGPFQAGIMSLLGDREGSVWFGLNAIGMAQWVGEPWSHRTTIDPSNPVPVTFAGFGVSRGATPHSLLVSIFQSGFIRLNDDGSVHLYGAKDGLTEDVRAAVEPEPGMFIAGTRFGIFEAERGKPFRQVLKLPSGFVMGLFKGPDGKWYAGSSTAGVLVRENGAWHPADAINRELDNMHVRDMKWSANGELWVATLRGITIFRGGNAEHLKAPEIPESVNAVLIVERQAPSPVGPDEKDRRGRLSLHEAEIWAGGTGGVAVRRNGRWTKMTAADGIPGQTIYSLGRGRDGAIWAGGSAGVGRYLDGKWTTWDSREGLLQEECNLNGLVVDDDGVVYAGTMGGLARFDPTVKALSPPPLTLQWKTPPAAHERAMHLAWTAAWLGPHPVQYRTRVPRLHDVWSSPSNENHLDVENLGAGDWRVEVQARVEGTKDWTAPIVADINVPPFWYETIPARIAMAALLIGLIYAAVRLRLRALHHRAAMLEQTVRERTAELRESEQRALAASRAKSAFLANMSHELRTPLNGVLGFAQLLSRRKDRDAEDREGLDIIMRSGEHLLGLINDVLSLSKIEAGRVTLEQEAFDPETLMHDVENVLRVRAEEKNLRLVCELDRESLPRAVVGDQGKLRQILINLAGNAVKFTAAGSVTLRVAWQHGRARFEVEDTGPGIDAAELPRLFEPFVQADSGQRTKEGTGLGLALSRDLARLMDGDITVISKPGSGSCFTVEVALPEAALEAIVEPKDRRRVTSLAAGQAALRVLVVDDTALNRTVLTRLLASVGFDVRAAAGGAEALEQWESWQPDFIWMDKRMPGIDGLEATRRIRARERSEGRKRVPIIALSASALEHERSEILGAGCDDFVAKPFREATIFAKMREHTGVEYAYETGSRSVLVVDDDWICRQVAQELLRGQGVAVTIASSGREAVDLASKSRFDLVFMDVQMPEMDGIETTRRIKASPGLARIPIIAMTADDNPAPGMDDHILKPVEPEALTNILSRWLPQ